MKSVKLGIKIRKSNKTLPISTHNAVNILGGVKLGCIIKGGLKDFLNSCYYSMGIISLKNHYPLPSHLKIVISPRN